MNFHKIIRIMGNPAREGRYIGGVRDKSAPTGGRINVLNAIIGTKACPGYFIHLIYKEVKHE